jgi:hypothetical protein
MPSMPYLYTRWIWTMVTLVLIFVGGDMPALAAQVDYGLLGITQVETSRISAYCAEESTEPCQVEFHFHDVRGRIVKQSTVTLQPGTAGFLDLTGADLGLTARRGEIVPCIRVLRGSAFTSLQQFDNFTQRTRLFTNWGDRALPLAGEAHFGLAGITPFDTARLSAFCSEAATRTGAAEPCEVTFIFHASGGRVFKQSTITLEPGTSGFLDLRAAEIGLTFRRGEIIPCIRVGRGVAVASYESIDTLTGLTLTSGYPAALITP